MNLYRPQKYATVKYDSDSQNTAYCYSLFEFDYNAKDFICNLCMEYFNDMQLDPSVLLALPLSLRLEIEQHYSATNALKKKNSPINFQTNNTYSRSQVSISNQGIVHHAISFALL